MLPTTTATATTTTPTAVTTMMRKNGRRCRCFEVGNAFAKLCTAIGSLVALALFLSLVRHQQLPLSATAANGPLFLFPWTHGRRRASVESSSPLLSEGECEVSFGTYRGGNEYSNHGDHDAAGAGLTTVGKPHCLVESKFLKLQRHKVSLAAAVGQEEATVVEDWLWIDYHDRVNVLVEAPAEEQDEEPQGGIAADGQRRFYVFEQSKYGLEGRTSLAVVGGIVEPFEAAETAARREVAEELGVVCSMYEFLGRYRTDVNR